MGCGMKVLNKNSIFPRAQSWRIVNQKQQLWVIEKYFMEHGLQDRLNMSNDIWKVINVE